jgi:hypothetical protein
LRQAAKKPGGKARNLFQIATGWFWQIIAVGNYLPAELPVAIPRPGFSPPGATRRAVRQTRAVFCTAKNSTRQNCIRNFAASRWSVRKGLKRKAHRKRMGASEDLKRKARFPARSAGNAPEF